jgi:hypothetical protein
MRHHTTLNARLLWPLLALVVVLTGCANEDLKETTPSTSSSTPSPSVTTATLPAGVTPRRTWTPSKPTPPATPTEAEPPPLTAWPAGTRTGDAFVDKVITLVEAKDWTGLADLALWTSLPCEAPRPVNPQPLLCHDGMHPGDMLTGFWMSDVEGGLWPPERGLLAAAFGSALSSAQLHAVYP